MFEDRSLTITCAALEPARTAPRTPGAAARRSHGRGRQRTHAERHAGTTQPTTMRRSSAAVARIVSAAANGDARAWDALVDEFGGLVWAVVRAHRLSHADGADVVQSTWLALVEHLDGLRDAERVGAWLATTARRKCQRLLHGAKRQVPVGDDLPEPCEDVEVVGDLMLEQRDAALWRALDRLPERDQALLRLLVADPQPSYEEISAALDMPIGSIGPTRARSLERLRRELARDGLAGPDLC
jgi:RNA polymerase sigma factor (sigma-70 family)